MRIPSQIQYIRKVSKEVEDLLRSVNTNESVVFDVRLSVEEALKNAIIHGNRNNKNLSVFVSYSLKDDKFAVEIEDEGAGFLPDNLPNPTKGENLLREGGRGVYLIHRLMDEVKYNDSGNRVIMVKYIKKDKGGCDAD